MYGNKTLSSAQRQRVTGLHLLRSISVREAVRDTPDGGGLWLRIRGDKVTWVYRYTFNGLRRDLSLGACYRSDLAQAGKSLADARTAAATARSQLAEGKDPILLREAKRTAARNAEVTSKRARQGEQLTLARAARAYHERVIEPNRSAKHGSEWLRSLEKNVAAAIWHKPVAEVTAVELLDSIEKLQARIPETARRVRQRLEVIFDDCEFRGQRSGNPARAIRRKLSEVKSKRTRTHFRALPYGDVPAFVAALRGQEGVAARMLHFALLTASRTNEVLLAVPSEFASDTWTIPGARMKGGEDHFVPLSSVAREILSHALKERGKYVFHSPRTPKQPCSNMAMLALLKRMGYGASTTVHGVCRSSFSTWAYETGAARPDVIEACLAHQETDRVKAAYNRAQFAAERRALLQAWADYLESPAPKATMEASNAGEFSQQSAA